MAKVTNTPSICLSLIAAIVCLLFCFCDLLFSLSCFFTVYMIIINNNYFISQCKLRCLSCGKRWWTSTRRWCFATPGPPRSAMLTFLCLHLESLHLLVMLRIVCECWSVVVLTISPVLAFGEPSSAGNATYCVCMLVSIHIDH